MLVRKTLIGFDAKAHDLVLCCMIHARRIPDEVETVDSWSDWLIEQFKESDIPPRLAILIAARTHYMVSREILGGDE